jgi:hypothetical protein
MLKINSSGPKCDRIFRRISSGKSFIDFGLLAIEDDLEDTPSLLLLKNNADSICT